MAGVGTGKYLENVSYPYASALSVLSSEEAGGQEAPPAGKGRQGPGTQPGGRGAAGAKRRRKRGGTLFWGRTRGLLIQGCNKTEREEHSSSRCTGLLAFAEPGDRQRSWPSRRTELLQASG